MLCFRRAAGSLRGRVAASSHAALLVAYESDGSDEGLCEKVEGSVQMKNWIYWWLDYLIWRVGLLTARRWSRPAGRGRRIVIVPCEPWTVIGSRGDEAMITAIIEAEVRADPSVEFVFVTGSAKFDDVKRFPNARFVCAWNGRSIIRSIEQALDRERPDAVYALGADCLDGKYSPRTSMILIAAAAYAAACGAETHLTGFSFNETPTPRLKHVFRAAAAHLAPFNLRDKVSKERFDRFAGVSSRLVADTAFLMQPRGSEATRRWAAWCKAEQSVGRVVVGINLNPMLFPKDGTERAMQIERIAKGLVAVRLAHPEVSVLLVPHDYRGGGDLSCLEVLYTSFVKDPQVAIVRDVLTAPELKELAGSLDLLFTCRMHLAIAALGQGKPIAGFAYQGKFAGLLMHFGLPSWLVGDVGEPEGIGEILNALVAQRNELTENVSVRLSIVCKLARLNVRGQ